MPTSMPIDFSQTSLAPATQYHNCYAKVIDHAFTAQECASLLELATSTDDWQPAGLGRDGAIHTSFRNSERVLKIDEDASRMIYERLKPFVEDIQEIKPASKWAAITVRPGRKQGPTWKMVRVNPRLSFLRYGPGHYFKPHCDGLLELEANGKIQKSFVTLHIYLNEGDGLEGGATRFWTPDGQHFLDVEPRLGSVLIFQQRMLAHSGEEVICGVKYTMRSDFMFEEVA
ncbi:hypothetical protein BDQ12DRAFT_689090 [Crucibulum laeve]|uniref:Prolyl 4-hydroxylase alpha subunit domain-containing protein n=1 Tax=Crucibulum laeve TaxID=68775 RepID=A0A5C3LQX8_9AGAR|nr:hypothetical protein BDQ12DRAFT_689090 [Crucibulum laeve]